MWLVLEYSNAYVGTERYQNKTVSRKASRVGEGINNRPQFQTRLEK